MSKYIDIVITRDPNPPSDGGTDFTGRTVPIEESVAERIIQEEIWAQTLWPEGEPMLASVVSNWQMLKACLKDDGTIDFNAAEQFFAEIRKEGA